MSYREHFGSRDAAKAYEEQEYADDSYASLLWRIERRQLTSILSARFPSENYELLDFACGTGRILEHVAPSAGRAVGVEISPFMAEKARTRVPNATIYCTDITGPNSDCSGPFDVITAFRFFLNAEPSLRVAAAQSLAERMRNQQSILVFNNHGNLISHKLIMALIRGQLKGRTRLNSGNVMTHREVKKLARAAGLSISRVAGAGLLGGRLSGKLPERLAFRVELLFSMTFLSRFGSNQVYVARKR